ncbi:Acid phosphatase-like protein 2 [Haplosporangium bisporale]|nr:Acid phosphatase-like protein 2 [Haplosporangium bisporale]
MPAYHHPPAHRLTVPLVLLLLTAGGLVLTSIRSYPTPQTINDTLQKVLDRPTQTSLNDLFDTIGSHPDRESTADYNYCQARRPDTETYPYPKDKDAKLVNSQLFVRHGDRTPITVLPLDLDLTWECANLSAFSFTGPATDQDEKSPFRYANVVTHQVVTIPPQSPWTHQMWHGSCITGQLTPLGAWQHRVLGAALRDLYVDHLRFLPPTFDPETVYIRSTDVWRTKQSAENLMAGLYGNQKTAKSSDDDTVAPPPVLQIHTLPVEMDYLTMNGGACPRMNQLRSQIEKASPVMKKLYEDNVDFNNELKTLLGAERTWSGYMDTIMPRVCHGKPLQCRRSDDGDDDDDEKEECVTLDTASKILDNVATQTTEMYRDAEGIFEVLQLGIGPLAQEIKHNLVAAKDGATKVLLNFYSGHDTTLSPLLGMLDSADMRWPPYASNMLVELWKSGSGEHFVRVIYNHKVVETKSKWCDLSWCPLDKFMAHLDRFYVSDLLKECQKQDLKHGKKIE